VSETEFTEGDCFFIGFRSYDVLLEIMREITEELPGVTDLTPHYDARIGAYCLGFRRDGVARQLRLWGPTKGARSGRAAEGG
jgi:hypothetical protein